MQNNDRTRLPHFHPNAQRSPAVSLQQPVQSGSLKEVEHSVKEFAQTASAYVRRAPEFAQLAADAAATPVKANDVLAKQILAHFYGEFLAIQFRTWVRQRIAVLVTPTDDDSCDEGDEDESFTAACN